MQLRPGHHKYLTTLDNSQFDSVTRRLGIEVFLLSSVKLLQTTRSFTSRMTDAVMYGLDFDEVFVNRLKVDESFVAELSKFEYRAETFCLLGKKLQEEMKSLKF